MKSLVRSLLPALVVVGLYLLLAGRDQISELRQSGERLDRLGTAEEHEAECLRLTAELRRAQEDLARRKAAAPAAAAPSRPGRTDSAALRDAHRRIAARPGTRILGVFRADRETAATTADDPSLALLRTLGRGEPRRWSVSLEAPWPSLCGVLDDFAAAGEGGPVLVRSLSMQPGVGAGKPTCWTLTICQTP